MPKTWIFYIALVLPLGLRILLLNTGFLEWLWYRQYVQAYEVLNALRAQPQFLSFIGGWVFPVFVITVFTFWIAEPDHDESIPQQFLLLPLAYIPFTVIGDVLLTGAFSPANLYLHPVVILPLGYLYVFTWVAFVRVFEKMRLVV